MPQRNAQNPIKFSRNTKGGYGNSGNLPNSNSGRSGLSAGICPSCKTEVFPKRGFRLSALSCPKCGTKLGKK